MYNSKFLRTQETNRVKKVGVVKTNIRG